jgi:NitT/TauT family transport system substrate-binding protein
MMSFDESARFCGVLEGDPPIGLGNGGIYDTIRLINEWWVKLGLLRSVHDPEQGVDCSLMGDLVASGYRQDF